MIFMLILLHAWVEKCACVDTYLLVLSFFEKSVFIFMEKYLQTKKHKVEGYIQWTS